MLPDVELVNANALMEEARYIKSSEEIEFLRSGAALVERAVDVVAAEARPGIPENIVYAHLISSIVAGGGELPSTIRWPAGSPQPLSSSYLPVQRPLRQGVAIIGDPPTCALLNELVSHAPAKIRMPAVMYDKLLPDLGRMTRRWRCRAARVRHMVVDGGRLGDRRQPPGSAPHPVEHGRAVDLDTVAHDDATLR